MKTKIISKLLLALVLIFVLGARSLRCTVRGLLLSMAQGISPGANRFIRLGRESCPPIGWKLVNFSVSGTAITGVDYAPLVSPVKVARVQCPPPANRAGRNGWE